MGDDTNTDRPDQAKVTPPEIGKWYRTTDGNTFEVVAVDEQDQTIEVQYFDGTVEELDTDAWNELVVERIEPPEDWSGSMDVDDEDLPDDDGEFHQEWSDPMSFVDEYE